MYPLLPKSFQDAFALAMTSLLTQFTTFLPKLLAALIVLILGAAIARWIKKLTTKGLEMLRLSKGLQATPVEAFLKHAEMGRIESIIGSAVYWLFMLFILYTTTALLGWQAVTVVLDKVINYIPSVFSAMIILFLGVLLSGVVESLVKGAIKSMDGRSARLLGKVSSYLVVVITVMAAISELKIAQEFISTLFIGLIAMLALAFGLAFGLGSKDVVNKIMLSWYERMKKEMTD